MKKIIFLVCVVFSFIISTGISVQDEPTAKTHISYLLNSGDGWVCNSTTVKLFPGETTEISIGTVNTNQIILWGLDLHGCEYFTFWLERPNGTRIDQSIASYGYAPECSGIWSLHVALDGLAPVDHAHIDVEILKVAKRIEICPNDCTFFSGGPAFYVVGGVRITSIPTSLRYECYYSLDNSSYSIISQYPFSWMIPPTYYPEGDNTTYVRLDYCWGTYRYSLFAHKDFTMDYTKPVISMINPSGTSVIINSSELDISWSATDIGAGINGFCILLDISHCWYLENDSTSQHVEDLSDGIYNLSIEVWDIAGNVEFANATITIDTTAPISSANISGSNITISARDRTSGVLNTHYRIDNGTWNIYTEPFTVMGNESYTIDFYSMDNAGNVEKLKTILTENNVSIASTSFDWLGYILVIAIFVTSLSFIFLFRDRLHKARQ